MFSLRRCLLALPLGLALALPAAAEPLTVTAVPLPLDAGDPTNTRLGPLVFADGLQLTSDHPRFGGWSGLIVSPDGRQIAAVGDQGSLLMAGLELDGNGALVGLEPAQIFRLADLEGKPLEGSERQDAEAIAYRGEADDVVVAFEREHRIWRYQDPESAARELPSPPFVAELTPERANQGMEALTALPGDRLVVLAEGLPSDGSVPGALWDGEAWQPLAYTLEDGFQVTDAAFLPHPEGDSGDLLVLERFYTPETGPRARVRLVPGEALRPGATLTGELWGELAPPRAVDNFEGLAAYRDADGHTWVLLLSDDNFNPLQRTLLLRFELAYE